MPFGLVSILQLWRPGAPSRPTSPPSAPVANQNEDSPTCLQCRSPYPTPILSSSGHPGGGMIQIDGPSKPGMFKGAHNFLIKGSTFVENHHHTHVNQGSDVLERLSPYTIPQDPLPRCHPNTRRSIINKTLNWFHSEHRTKSMLWISGPAGVGKSAIMGSVAVDESTGGRVGATVFFSGQSGSDDPRRLIHTIAYQLALKFPAYRSYLGQLLFADPQLLEREAEELFQKFIETPFGECGSTEPWLILIDGLDECDRGDGGQRGVRDIINMINSFAEQHPASPFVWIIASRPERWLRTTLSHPAVKRNCWNEHVTIDTPEARQDIEVYLDSEFTEIREHFPYHIPTDQQWPSSLQRRDLARAVSGLFVYASTTTRFIRDPRTNNPVRRLESVLTTIANSGVSSDQHNPLSGLYNLYLQILKAIPSDTYARFAKRILGCRDLLHRNTFYITSFILSCNFLGIRQSDAYSALDWLHSVLEVPSPQDATIREFKFLHSSFPDFLRNPAVPDEFRVDRSEAGQDIAECSLRILKQANESTGSSPQISNISLSWDHGSEKTREALLKTAYDGFRMLTLDERKFNRSFTLSKRVKLLAEVDFSKLDCYVNPDVKTSVHHIRAHHQNLFEWLVDKMKSSPQEFRKSRLVEDLPWRRLDKSCIRSDRTSIHFSYTKEKGKLVVRPKVYSDVEEIREKYKGEYLAPLKKILQSYRRRPLAKYVQLWGNDPTKSCLLFEYTPKIQRSVDGRSTVKEIFFIPYRTKE